MINGVIEAENAVSELEEPTADADEFDSAENEAGEEETGILLTN